MNDFVFFLPSWSWFGRKNGSTLIQIDPKYSTHENCMFSYCILFPFRYESSLIHGTKAFFHTKEVKKKKRTDTFQIYNHHLSWTDCVHFYAKKVSFLFKTIFNLFLFLCSLLLSLSLVKKASCIQINNARMLIAIKIKYMDKVGQLSPWKNFYLFIFFHRLLT